MTPEEAVERYLKEKKPRCSDSTYYNYSSLLSRFFDWCEEEDGPDSVGDLDGFHLSDFKMYRREEDGINEVTLYNQMTVMRVFIRWLESRGLVESGLSDNMLMPQPDDDARTEKIDSETAGQILQYLQKYEYATKRHALFTLLWDTGFRIGTVRALDLGDYHPDEQYVELNHRPETDTPLKNGTDAEREVNLHGWVCEVLDDYVGMHRDDVTDEAGREPLLTTAHGRPVASTLRPLISTVTRPCHYGEDCPHDRNPESCEAAQRREYAQRCPSSVPPHAIRRSSITAWLNRGHRKELISDRMDVSTDTLDKHYDARSETEKRELRQEAFGME